MSIEHHFFPLNVQVLEKCLRKNCSISAKLTQKKFKRHQFCSDNTKMSHQISTVHHFFPFNVRVQEKIFLMKSYFISEK